MLIVFEIAPEMKGCAAAIIWMGLSTDSERRPMRPHGLAQSNTARCSGLRCGAPSNVIAPQRQLLAASISARAKPSAQQLEAEIIERARRDPETIDAESFPQGPFIKREFDVESRGERRLDRGEGAVVEPFFLQTLVIDVGRAFERAVA